jgi:DNA (cytosine-5)-methyltransferase 1
VIESPEPFIISLTHHGGDRVEPLNEPFKTVTGANRGEKALVQPFIVNMAHRGKLEAMDQPISTIATEKGGCRALVSPTLIQTGYGERPALFRCIPCGEDFTDRHATEVGGLAPAECPICGEEERIELLREAQSPRVPGLDKPLGTVVAGGPKHALVSAFLAKHYGGHWTPGAPLDDPISTITAQDHHGLVASSIVKLRGTCRHGQPLDQPMATISAQGLHIAEVRAFLIAYYGNERDGGALTDPMRTTTAKERFGLVTIYGEEYMIVDIGLRMLTPRELYRGQGFKDSYIIDPIFEGKPLSKTAQVRMCGNSVCPPNAAAMVRAQFGMEPQTLAA